MKKPEKTTQTERPVYMLCPRCEINYIDKREKLCAVCKAELGIGDPSILLPEDDDEQENRLCPVCHINPLGDDEEICFECKKEREAKEKESQEVSDSEDDDNPNSWEPFDDEEENDIPDGMQEIFAEDEEEEEEEEEIETVSDEPDDFDFDVDPNDFMADDEDEEEEDDL